MNDKTLANWKLCWTTPDGHEMEASVSPCSWMYPGYGIQIEVSGKDLHSLFRNSKILNVETVTETDLQALASLPVEFVPCSRPGCRGERMVGSMDDRTTLCGACFAADIRAEYEQESLKETVRQQKAEARMYKKGYRWAVDAWIHPGRGDDYQQTSYWTEKPSKDSIEKSLSRKSQVKDNYCVRALTVA